MELTPDTRAISEMFVDIVDVFDEPVDEDSRFTLLSTCLEVSGLDDGSVSIVDVAGLTGPSVSTTPLGTDERDYLSRRCLTTMSTEFTATATTGGVECDWAVPMRARSEALGVVRLHSADGRTLDSHVLATIQNLADTAAIAIDRTHAVQQGRALVSQLQSALDSRVRIEQAKGVLAERHGTGFDDAFRHLRTTARSERRPIADIADEVIAGVGSTNGRP